MFKPQEKPKALPQLPPLREHDTSEIAKANVDNWVRLMEETQRENDALFEKALKKIKACAFLNGALGRPLTEHFSWCPHNEWDAYWQEQGWPPLPQVRLNGDI